MALKKHMFSPSRADYQVQATQPRWSGVHHASTLSDGDCAYLPYIAFAAGAESSTQHAFEVLLQQLILTADEARREGQKAKAELVDDFHCWLIDWAKEEQNHVDFFDSARSHLMHSSDTKRSMERERYGVEAPIPESQTWVRTLLFLLYSEIASMVWYRAWSRMPVSVGLRNALVQLHRDESQHYVRFLEYTCALAALEPQLVSESRSVLAAFTLAFRRVVQRTHTAGRDVQLDRSVLNWWEHPVFAGVDNVELIVQRIRGVQKYSFSCIEKAAENKCRAAS